MFGIEQRGTVPKRCSYHESERASERVLEMSFLLFLPAAAASRLHYMYGIKLALWLTLSLVI